MAAERKSPRGPAPPCLHAPAGGGRAGRGRAMRGAVVRPRNGPCRPARWVQCVRPDPRARWRGLETRACLGDVRDVACRGRASRYCLSCWRAWREAQCVDPCAVVPGVLPSCVRLTRPPDPARPPALCSAGQVAVSALKVASAGQSHPGDAASAAAGSLAASRPRKKDARGGGRERALLPAARRERPPRNSKNPWQSSSKAASKKVAGSWAADNVKPKHVTARDVLGSLFLMTGLARASRERRSARLATAQRLCPGFDGAHGNVIWMQCRRSLFTFSPLRCATRRSTAAPSSSSHM